MPLSQQEFLSRLENMEEIDLGDVDIADLDEKTAALLKTLINGIYYYVSELDTQNPTKPQRKEPGTGPGRSALMEFN